MPHRDDFADDLWDDAAAARLDPLGRLVYRSNLLGSDSRITNTGGGNTSAKLVETDPLTERKIDVLWVKGSGGDLRTSTRANFASLYLDKVAALKERYLASNDRGPKSAIEDALVGLYPQCAFNLNPRAASIDTPLHAFVPFQYVDHTHPNSVIAVAAAENGERLTHAIYGEEIVWLPWQRPGFDLGLKLQAICQRYPKAKGVVLGKHGLINWADDDRECYKLTLRLIRRAGQYIAERAHGKPVFGGPRCPAVNESDRHGLLAELLPWLRGLLSARTRVIATVQGDQATLEFVNSVDVPRLSELGTSCPDHFLRTKIKPLFIGWDSSSGDLASLKALITSAIAHYRNDYAAYYERCRRPDSPPMRDPNPTVILIPGLGMIAWGKDKSESRVTAEFYGCAIQVMRGAEAMDRYSALAQQEAFDIEYWALEEAKLKRMPAEKELARRVAAVVGAGSGIGRAVALRLAREGAHVVCADLRADAAEATAAELVREVGAGIGVAGSGVSACGPAVGTVVDITRRSSVREMLNTAVLAFGGLDAVVVTAGVFVAPDADGRIADDQWPLTFAVNVTGSYVVANEAARLWREQGLTASMVLTTSANAVVAKKGSTAYDVSKAAVNHLIRELAVELAPLARVNGLAPATVVEGSAMFPRERVLASLTKYGIGFDAAESDDQLRARLAGYYAGRSLTRTAISPDDQAEAVFLLVGDRLSKTTGQVLAVDGGLVDAFLR